MPNTGAIDCSEGINFPVIRGKMLCWTIDRDWVLCDYTGDEVARITRRKPKRRYGGMYHAVIGPQVVAEGVRDLAEAKRRMHAYLAELWSDL